MAPAVVRCRRADGQGMVTDVSAAEQERGHDGGSRSGRDAISALRSSRSGEGRVISTGRGVSQRGQRLIGPQNSCPQKQATVQDM